jgi:RimJ/RimL family protein N-acetyltransferase
MWLEILFEQYDSLPHIGLTTWSGNKAMMRVSEKLGLKLEGQIRQVRWWQGQYWDSMKYGILRNEMTPISPSGKIEL